ncbi:GNAT family N-acetyltransferase [Ammoniphilus resinae]|uniref:GNAT superfamily N-acetyltransferase n=1 Tax=Ammoniphilus resinae TaxID=861532 RepID=A0ABS4GIV0_9BACL|nr:GNAT superfamily N-acetyltransferase [Ammoniphilus resinae]
MDNVNIIEGSINELKDVYQQFTQDFAVDELKGYAQLEFLLTQKGYKLLLAKDRKTNETIGYAFIYVLQHVKAIWLDYMAIMEGFRNAGYGTTLFNKMVQYNQDGLGLFVEVELPTEGPDKENQIRRINFYERLGAKRLHIPYEFPTNHGGFPMYLYFKPNVHVIPKKLIQESLAEVFEIIHSDVLNRNQILQNILPKVKDEYFK